MTPSAFSTSGVTGNACSCRVATRGRVLGIVLGMCWTVCSVLQRALAGDFRNLLASRPCPPARQPQGAHALQPTWWLHMRSVSTRRRTGTTGGSAIMEVVISSETVSLSSTICGEKHGQIIATVMKRQSNHEGGHQVCHSC